MNEWAECELNEGGLQGLLLQEKEDIFSTDGQQRRKRIMAVFALHDGEAVLVYHGINNQSHHYLFLGINGNIVEHFQCYSVIRETRYTHHKFYYDRKTEVVYSLEINHIWDVSELGEEWLEENPGMEEGFYYMEYHWENGDRHKTVLMEEQFMEAFIEMTGFPFFELEPEWYEWYKLYGQVT